MNDALAGMMGLCRRAGKLAVGMTAVEGSLYKKRARVVFLDGRAARNTRRQVEAMCTRANCPLCAVPENFLQDTLQRANTTVVAVEDVNFASRMLALYQQMLQQENLQRQDHKDNQ